MAVYTEKETPFDSFVQVIDGEADVVIEGQSHILKLGELIVIPAQASNLIRPNGRFKLIQPL